VTPLRILIVDDHAVVRRGVRSLLESQAGWEIAAEAATGREAVDLARQLQPDIVVMDLSLPELNGLDATRQILKESPRSEVLVLTMHHSEELARNMLQAGARGYVLKSDADQNLIAALTRTSLSIRVSASTPARYNASAASADAFSHRLGHNPSSGWISVRACLGRETPSRLGFDPVVACCYFVPMYSPMSHREKAAIERAQRVASRRAGITADRAVQPLGEIRPILA